MSVVFEMILVLCLIDVFVVVFMRTPLGRSMWQAYKARANGAAKTTNNARSTALRIC